MNIEEVLIELDFHDKSFESIHISLDDELILFKLRSYDDDVNDYYTTELKFMEVSSLQIGDFIDWSSTEILTFELEKHEDVNILTFLMSQGSYRHTWEIKFTFKKLIVGENVPCT